MGIEIVREGNQCEKCKKLSSEVGEIKHYTNHDRNLLLCSECTKKCEKPYTETCPKCKKLAYKHGGLTYYDDSDIHEFDGYTEFDSDEHGVFKESDSDEQGSFNYFDSHQHDEEPPSFEMMCLECHGKKVAKVKKNRKTKLMIKNFAKDHWKFWISTSIAIVFGIIGLSLI